jgi:NitT/TauT family transport system substrate-binding protein
VAHKSSGIIDFSDLAGKKVGVPLGTTANYFAVTALNAGGVKAKLLNVRPPEAVAAITTGEIDAMAVFQPTKAKIIEALGEDAVPLHSPGDRYIQHSLYLALDHTIKTKRKAIVAFLNAIKRADKPLSERSDEAVKAVVDSTKLSNSMTAKILAEFDFDTQLKPELATEMRKLSDWAQENKLLPAGPKVNYSTAIDRCCL